MIGHNDSKSVKRFSMLRADQQGLAVDGMNALIITRRHLPPLEPKSLVYKVISGTKSSVPNSVVDHHDVAVIGAMEVECLYDVSMEPRQSE